MKRKGFKTAAIVTMMSLLLTGTAFAGSWASNEKGTWWQFEDGTYPAGRSMPIDEDFDGKSVMYYFDQDGYRLENGVTPDGNATDSEGRILYPDGRIQEGMTYANYVGGNTEGITGYYSGAEGQANLVDGTTNNYFIYFGMAVKEVDANTISVLSDQFDFYEPGIYHKTADGVYEAKYEYATYKITFEGSNSILDDGYGYEIFKK